MPGDAGWEKFKKDYPEFAAPLEERFNAVLETVRKDVVEPVRERVEKVGERVAQSDEDRALEAEARRLAVKHPDFVQIKDSSEFETYLSTLPRAIAALVDSDRAEDADYLLTQYKASSFYKTPAPPAPANGAPLNPSPPLDPKRQRQLDGARTPRTGATPPAAAVTTIPDDPEGAWKAYERMGL